VRRARAAFEVAIPRSFIAIAIKMPFHFSHGADADAKVNAGKSTEERVHSLERAATRTHRSPICNGGVPGRRPKWF
jgi:hypothetical protein